MTIESKLIARKERRKKLASHYLKSEIKRPYESNKSPITIIVEPE